MPRNCPVLRERIIGKRNEDAELRIEENLELVIEAKSLQIVHHTEL